MPKIKLSHLVLLGLCFGLCSCSLIDYYFLPPPEDTAQELYENGMDAMQSKDYGEAAESFAKLKDRFPFSPYAPAAELGLGDAYYLDTNFEKAEDAYKEFEALHPRHKDTPYVLFQVGMCNYKQFESIDLRQDHVREGLEYFYRVAESYPNTEYGVAAEEYIVMSRTKLAEHEVYIADLYWRTERYGPAWKRYTYVMENFSDIPELFEYARKRAEYAYYEYQKTLSEEERAKIHGTWKEWFDWL